MRALREAPLPWQGRGAWNPVPALSCRQHCEGRESQPRATRSPAWEEPWSLFFRMPRQRFSGGTPSASCGTFRTNRLTPCWRTAVLLRRNDPLRPASRSPRQVSAHKDGKDLPADAGGQQGSAGVYVLVYAMAHGMLEDGAGGKSAVVVHGLEAVARNDRRCAVGGLAVAWHRRLAQGQREADGRGVPQGQRVCDLRL